MSPAGVTKRNSVTPSMTPLLVIEYVSKYDGLSYVLLVHSFGGRSIWIVAKLDLVFAPIFDPLKYVGTCQNHNT